MIQQAGGAPVADCHVHIFDPERFPYVEDTDYRPVPNETAPIEQLIAVMDANGISHALLVTPTAGYRADNSPVVDAIRRYPDRLGGIGVIDNDATEDDLAALKAAGICGIRMDLVTRGAGALEGSGVRMVGMLRELDMILQIQTECDLLDGVAGMLASEAGTIVFDHMGRPDPAAGMDQAGFRALLGMANHKDAAVKLSGPFRFSNEAHPYRDADPYARAVLDAYGPDRCVWGSDWPFVRMDRRLDYGPALAALGRWVDDEQALRKILWDTPSRLYGFSA